jgi:small subunit ribosomal protein S16
MATKIRLSRHGAKKKPFYRIVVTDVRSPRDGKFIEIVGTYNPMLPSDNADRVTIKQERMEHWLALGAEPTEVVSKFITKKDIKNPFADKVNKRKRSTERQAKPAKTKENS